MNKRSEYLKEIILFKVNRYSIITMLVALVLNIGGHYLSGYLNLPVWLDTIGTMAVAIQFGPLAGAIIGICSFLICGIPYGVSPLYVIVGIITGVFVGFLFPRKHREDTFSIVTVAILTAIVSTIVSFPLNIYFYKGYTGNEWGDALFRMLKLSISSRELNAFISELFLDLPDRVISIFIAIILVDIEEIRIFKKKNRSITRTMAGILVFIMAGSMFAAMMPRKVNAIDFDADFETVIYGSDDGILTAEVNAIAQTNDGFLWVGTYAGIYKYNGIKFEPVDLDESIRNVMTLFVDSRGRLWIGTNDSGAVCYDPTTGETESYSTANGLNADSIRAISEDSNGNIYLGTVRSITKVFTDGRIKTFSEWEDVYYCVSFAGLDDGSIVGVTNGGILFLIKNDMLMSTDEFDYGDGIDYKSVARHGDDIIVGTTDHSIVRYKVENDELSRKSRFIVPNVTYFNDLSYSDKYNGYFYCCENGFGFIDGTTYGVTDMTNVNFGGSVSDVCIDEQGNIWFASNKQGLMKFSHTPFGNVFNRTGLKSGVVNALCKDNDYLYVGMDNGLKIINTDTNTTVTRSWATALDGVRVRHIMKDSSGNLWISTYGPDGLIKVDPSGQYRNFNEQNGGLLGGRCRSAIELSDGRILVASNMGLSFIQNDTVVATIGENNGLNNQFILSMYEREDGSIMAASDGDGIYIIRNDRVAGHIGATEGLNTSVVLRIVKCTGDGFLYITSNAVYYDDGTGQQVRRLENFPYPNNYDIIITDDGTCWITSSAGLYIVNEQTLVEDGEYSCTLLNKNWGLNSTFTAVSWNVLNDENIYFCCTDGVRRLSINEYENKSNDYQIHLESIESNDEILVQSVGLDTYTIPPSTGRISFNIAINNYSLTNPLIHCYLEGTTDSGITAYQNEMTPLEFTNLSYGDYVLHVQVIDETSGEIIKEETFNIEKQAMMYEKLYFRIYLLFVGAWMAFYIAWVFVTINRRASRIRGLQKEMSTDPMTGLYNKSASERVLTDICSQETGVLLMIDLDSFKLVNDLYGHDMGDRILIRFAEIIREAVGEGNMGGRLGGDEFIGFVKDTLDEDDVERITKMLNREIVKSAKEYMGEDMNIPLGASVGAVRVPVEGREFSKLFRLADKALYIVKQNGKHGYAFYQKGSDNKDEGENDSDKNNLSQIKKIIGERNEGKGAFFVNFDKLQTIYKFLNRNNKMTDGNSGFVRIMLETTDESKVTDEARDAFEEALITHLKKNDVVSRYAGNFYVIFNGSEPSEYESIVERVEQTWKESGEFASYKVSLEIEKVGE